MAKQTTPATLAHVFAELDRSDAMLDTARRCGDFTDRSDPAGHEASRIHHAAIGEALRLGFSEVRALSLWRAAKGAV